MSNGDILTNITKDYHSSKIHIDKDFYYKLSSIVDDVDFWSDEDDEDELIEKEKLYCCCYKWININRLKINELTIEELLKNKYQFLLNEDKKNSRKKIVLNNNTINFVGNYYLALNNIQCWDSFYIKENQFVFINKNEKLCFPLWIENNILFSMIKTR